MLYSVQVLFADGREPFMRCMMPRVEYAREMRRIEKDYRIDIEKVEEYENGDRFIFARATDRIEALKNMREMEKVKSRARYYARKVD